MNQDQIGASFEWECGYATLDRKYIAYKGDEHMSIKGTKMSGTYANHKTGEIVMRKPKHMRAQTIENLRDFIEPIDGDRMFIEENMTQYQYQDGNWLTMGGVLSTANSKPEPIEPQEDLADWGLF